MIMQCRMRVFAREDGYSADSDSEEDERSPLVRPSASAAVGGGTFSSTPNTAQSAIERLQARRARAAASAVAAEAGEADQAASGTQSDPTYYTASEVSTSQSQRFPRASHRRFFNRMRPRRLQRVHEALQESSTSAESTDLDSSDEERVVRNVSKNGKSE